MTVCDPPVPPVEVSSKPDPAPVLGDCLIRTPQEAQNRVLTANRTTDSRTALKKGLADYLMSLPPFIHPTHGREVELRKIYDTWPEQEEKTQYPSAVVFSPEKHPYESSSFTPILDPDCKVDATTYLVKHAEVNFNMVIDILSTDPEERICFGMQMEDALNPVDWMYGFQLELPHYHNLRGVYQVMDGNHPDDEPSVFKRNRHLTLTVNGQVSMVTLKKLTPLTEVRTTVVVVDGNDPC